MTRPETCNALLVFPRFNPNSFWNYQATCDLVGASYPAAPLGLITMAAMLPAQWQVRLVDRNTGELSDADLAWADVVMTGGMMPQQQDALWVIAQAHRCGKPVVVGGPDATSSPHVYGQADFRVLGEAEAVLSEFIQAWDAGEKSGQFSKESFPDVTTSPVPRFDLLKFTDYLHVGVQFSRGCPYNCEFCDIIELYGRVPRVKSDDQILAELDRLYALGYRGHVDFVDDNLIGNKVRLKQLLPKLTRWLAEHGQPFEFTTEMTVNAADDPELLRLMQEAEFFAVFVGIESPDTDTLVHMQKRQNTRRVLQESVHKIYAAGMFVNAGFIIGFDTEKASVADAMVQCIEETDIPVCMVGLLYALPNTQLTRRLQLEGRLFPDHDVVTTEKLADQCTSGLNYVTARPRAEALEDYRDVLRRVYEPAAYFRRARAVGRALDCSKKRFRQPLSAMLRDLRSFGRMAWRLGVRDPLVRREFWTTMADTLLHNPRALRFVGAFIALYAHFGPYSRFLVERIGNDIDAVKSGAWVQPEVGVESKSA